MKSLMEKLLTLQGLELESRHPAQDVQKQIEELRKKLPESLLFQFDRWIVRGRKAVAVVRNGVCCQCHIRLAVGVVGALAFGDAIERCGNCGRFLYLPDDEPVLPEKRVEKAKSTRRTKKASVHAG